MILTTSKTPDWTSSDAIALREVLQSDVFSRALIHVSDQAPELLDGGDVNKTLVRNGEVKGYAAALSNLFRLTIEQPPTNLTPPEAYPSLDDDSKWENAGKSQTETH